MGGRSSKRPQVNWRKLNIVNYEEIAEPEKSIIERPISKLDKRQQWQIVLNDDKKIFKLKNVETNTYLYIGQEPTEGIPEFATIDLDKGNYKYDPAYIGISKDDLINKTEFSFISSFGTQLDIVDKNDTDIKENKAILQTIKATRVRITTQLNEQLNIFGVFIYGQDGTILNEESKYAYSSSNYQNKYPASNAMKIVKENLNRKAFDAIQNNKLNNKQIGWNNLQASGPYCSLTNKDNTGEGGGSWWEYEFDNPLNVSLIEIFGRTDCCADRNKLRIDLYNDSENKTKIVWTNKFDDMLYDAHKAVKIIN
jgi:hypothetical protein